MSLNPSSKGRALLVVALVVVLAAVPAAAVTVSDEEVPEEAAVGDKVEASFTLTKLYQDPRIESWNLRGETQLTNVTWTVAVFDQTDSKIDQFSYDGSNFTHEGISTDSGIAKVVVTVRGDAPAVEEFIYPEEENFTVATLTQTREAGTSNEIISRTMHHYTTGGEDSVGSKEARNAIAAAEGAIADANESGADTSEARASLTNAINAYESENFKLAKNLANEAATKAENAKQKKASAQQRNKLLLIGGGVVVLLGLVGGGVYWYRNQQDDYDKLG